MPTSSPIPIRLQASTSGSPARDLARLHRLLEAGDVPPRQPLVVERQRLGRDELGLPDDPVERRVLGGEAEERAEAEQLRSARVVPCAARLASSPGGRGG